MHVISGNERLVEMRGTAERATLVRKTDERLKMLTGRWGRLRSARGRAPILR